jgi:class 3 adenylate cyclase
MIHRFASRRRPVSENIEGERETVTALFANSKDSTELMEELDPEAARMLIDPAFKMMIEAVHRNDGYVVQSTGDGIFTLFSAPVAHEIHPQSALYAALWMQEDHPAASRSLNQNQSYGCASCAARCVHRRDRRWSVAGIACGENAHRDNANSGGISEADRAAMPDCVRRD